MPVAADAAPRPLGRRHQARGHRYLDDIAGLGNPTSEMIARWMWRRLKPALPQLAEIKLLETCSAGSVYRGEDE
ncbi:MAG TPA: 6-carboxytetrahydropterin synthase [Rhodospirillales bacterium]